MLSVHWFTALAIAATVQVPVGPLVPGAISESDHLRTRPLKEALEMGFPSASIEVRIEAGKLVLNRKGPQMTVAETYWKPLEELLSKPGSPFDGSRPFRLFLRAPKDADAVWKALDGETKSLQRFLPIVTEQGREHRGLEIIWESEVRSPSESNIAYGCALSIAERANQPDRYLYSFDSWMTRMRWLGVGSVSPARREGLVQAVRRAQALGYKVRLVRTPDNPNVWSFLQISGVDFIGTENLPLLRDWLRRNPMPAKDHGAVSGSARLRW